MVLEKNWWCYCDKFIERVMGICIGFKFFIYLINDKCLFCDIFCIVRNVSLLINDR